MSALTAITSESDFQSRLASHPSTSLLVLYFHASWAAPCAQMTTILTAIAATYPPSSTSPVFLSVDAEELPDISETYDVAAVPFLVLIKAGKTVETVSGSDAQKVRDAIERHGGKGPVAESKALPPALEVTKKEVAEPALTSNGAGPHATSTNGASETTPTEESKAALHARLTSLVKAAPVMLFMKGTPSAPQCGFSRQLVALLRERAVRYGFFNILADEEVRQGLKEFADWPTFPQLWVDGELVGGLDIAKEEIENDPDYLKQYAAKPTAAVE